MSIYVPALIWVISAGICYYIAKRKNIRPTALWNITVALLGPIAIPLILIAKNNKMNINGGSNKNSESNI